MSFDIESDRQVLTGTCSDCGTPMKQITGFVLRDGGAYAIYLATCYHHDGHEVWIDAIFSPTWEENAEDHYTIGCRVGPIEGQPNAAASLVAAAANREDSRVFGHKLTREEALVHPQLAEYWELIDHILVTDPDVAEHMYGTRPAGPAELPS